MATNDNYNFDLLNKERLWFVSNKSVMVRRSLCQLIRNTLLHHTRVHRSCICQRIFFFVSTARFERNDRARISARWQAPSMSTVTRCHSERYIFSFNLRAMLLHGESVANGSPIIMHGNSSRARTHHCRRGGPGRSGGYVSSGCNRRSVGDRATSASWWILCEDRQANSSYLWWSSRKCPPPRRLCCSRCSRASSGSAISVWST